MFTYQWEKVGNDSLPDTASGGNSTQLTITSISPSDSGMYYHVNSFVLIITMQCL